MADMNAEMAFLDSMRSQSTDGYRNNFQAQNQSLQNISNGDDDDEDYDPSSLISNTSYAPNVAQTPSSTTASRVPSRVNSTAPDSQPVKSQPTKQPRTVGGFVVDDEEEEDDNPMLRPKVAGSSGLLSVAGGPSHTPQRSVSQTPSNIPPPDVSIHKAAPDQAASGVVPNTATTDPATPNAASFPAPTGASSSGVAVKSESLSNGGNAVAGETKPSTVLPKARLPNDRIGILEDRIADDPRGDLDAWLSLINEYRRRNKLDDARAVFERFFKVFPTAAEQWVAYANMELEINDFYRVEQIFAKALLAVPNVQLWSTYLDYVRRRNNLITDTTGQARQVVSATYDFVLQHVGIDKDSGQIWQDYINFLRSGPGILGGSTWQDQQKMDLMRKAFQKAICVPTQAVTQLWKEYDGFEMGLNKMTGRKFLQEKSPAYMTARGSYVALQNITRELNRTTMPRLPPAPGFDGEEEYMKQVAIWKSWVEWEKEDPLVLKDEDIAAYRARIIYVYKQAVMALRFWPQIWYEAAEWCFQNDKETEGNDFLIQGIAGNSESCLLAFKRADRLELTTTGEQGHDSADRRATAVREPYDTCLDTLYDLHDRTRLREQQAIARIRENFAQMANAPPNDTQEDAADDEQNEDGASDKKEAMLKMQIEAIQKGNAVQLQLLERIISFTWIACMRALRRIKGKGAQFTANSGLRGVLQEARSKGRITPDLYIHAALMEWHCYKDPVAQRLFDKAFKLYPTNENVALEYLKFLINNDDITNARAVFETAVNRMAQKPETLPGAKPLYVLFHDYESRYGELSQITKLEKRMAELFPEDPQLLRFTQRYSTPNFDPTAIRPIISPATQARTRLPPTLDVPAPMQNSPRPPPVQVATTSSPKRPFVPDNSDAESQPRKLARGESPLKGAAGRRLDAAKRNLQRGPDGAQTSGMPMHHHNQQQALPPPSLPREVLFLLSIIPRAETYNATIFSPEKMVALLRGVDMGRANLRGQGAPPAMAQGQVGMGYGGIGNVGYPYNR